MTLFGQLKSGKGSVNLGKDALAGIVVALVSIPISMGYAQIAGLPSVYGLYGSLLPILVYGFLTTTRQFVVGVDAMPAVMAGSLLAEFGIMAESPEALCLIPLVSFLTAIWFVIFYLLKAGRIVKFISSPVMSGFISGVGLTIILMQIPKLFGGSAGTGELFKLIGHIFDELPEFHLLSAVLGFGTFFIILAFKRIAPKVPMTVVMMFVGAVLQALFHLDEKGVKMLSAVEGGLPHFVIPGFKYMLQYGRTLIIESLSIAAVIMAQTLLASGSMAMKYNDTMDNGRELLAYSAMNIASAFSGCCPINGSVSRSGIADSFGCRSQVMSIAAFVTMLLVLLFGTPLLKFLPVPVLTGIVMTALWGILDFRAFKKLLKSSRNELIIFLIAFFGVLIFGTVYGVMIGVVLSFFDVAIAAVDPPVAFVGRIPGQGNFHSLKRNQNARPIEGAVIYRFSGNLFFANIDRFCSDVEAAIKDNTRVIVIDARGIGSIDVTAAERLVMLNRNLRAGGILFYITEHDGSLNDKMKKLGAECLLTEGVVRRTITTALADAGLNKPYELEGCDTTRKPVEKIEEQLVEFKWIFGDDAGTAMERYAAEMAEKIVAEKSKEAQESALLSGDMEDSSFHTLAPLDEESFIDNLELSFEKHMKSGRLTQKEAEKMILMAEKHRHNMEEKLAEANPELLERLKSRRKKYSLLLERKNPQAFSRMKYIKELAAKAEARSDGK